MEINWTALTYAVIALFAISGFFKGWWKEAITTGFLAALVFLLRNPDLAQVVINAVNNGIQWLWKFVPNGLHPTLEQVFNLQPGEVPLIDAGDPGTWLVILIFFIAASIIVSRYSLRNYGAGAGYEVKPAGSVLGGLLGGLNGFIIMGLIREYLNGVNLPGGVTPTTAAIESGGTVGAASSGVVLSATNVPATTLLDSYLPWFLMLIGAVVFLAAMKNRVGYAKNKDGYRRIHVKQPYGYKKYGT